jgi:hypothetical protein
MLSRRLTRGALITAALAAPVTVVIAGALVVDHVAPPREHGRRPAPAVDGGPAAWRRGASFATETGCFDYAGRQIWITWECRHEGRRWTYYWTEPTGFGNGGDTGDAVHRDTGHDTPPPRPMTGPRNSPYAGGQTP